MRQLVTGAVGALLLVLLPGCQPGSVPAGEPDFTDADRQAIEDVAARAMELVNGSDDWQSAYVDLYYAEDATADMEGSPTVRGKAAIVAWMGDFTGLQDYRIEQEQIEGGGDLAYVYGLGSFTMPGPEGIRLPQRFRFVEIWKRQADGSWKVAHDIAHPVVEPVEQDMAT